MRIRTTLNLEQGTTLRDTLPKFKFPRRQRGFAGIHNHTVHASAPHCMPSAHVDTLVARWHAKCMHGLPLLISHAHRRRGQAESTAAREGSVVVVPRKDAKLARLRRLHIIRARAEAAVAANDERLHNRSRRSSADDKDEAASPSKSHGAVSLIGRRREMEDAVTAPPGFASSSVADGGIPVPAAYDFFGVYDGHCGASVACACRDRLHVVLAEEVAALGRWPKAEDQWRAVMEVSFSRMDRELAAPGETEEGSTAVVAVVGTECIVVANCGDSRALLCRGGVAVPLSSDHKPDRPDEKKRVEAAGGRVVNWDVCRVSGVLAVSRSLGDHYLKPYVTSVPEVTVTERNTEDELLILASDGLWDVLSNETSCRVASRYLNRQPATKASEKKGREPSAAQAAALLAELAYSRGSRDNISVVVVRL